MPRACSVGARAMSDRTGIESIGRRYEVLGALGQGGMGTVLLARDRLGGRVALKRLASAEEQWEGAIRAVGDGAATVCGAIIWWPGWHHEQRHRSHLCRIPICSPPS